MADLGARLRLAPVRRAVRAADRRRRHARRDLAAERVHRPGRGGDRIRAREQRADRQRHARRRVGHDAHDADGTRDEPLDRERPLRRVRPDRGAGGRCRGGPVRTGRCARRARRTSRSCSATRARSCSCPATAWPSRRRSTTCATLADLLETRGVEVSYAIHPVAGRMPGHMNVLLAEANVPYPQLKEMDEVKPGVLAHGRRARDRRERRRQPGRAQQHRQPDLRDADPQRRQRAAGRRPEAQHEPRASPASTTRSSSTRRR